jgi:hypothetical protein
MNFTFNWPRIIMCSHKVIIDVKYELLGPPVSFSLPSLSSVIRYIVIKDPRLRLPSTSEILGMLAIVTCL